MDATSYNNRTQAGQLLAEQLKPYAQRSDVIVLGLPRGGVPVAAALAEALGAPLDIVPVRKLGVPGYEELAMGAVADDGEPLTTPEIVQAFNIPPAVISASSMRETKEITRREALYRQDNPPLQLENQTVILVDDGIATGATMLAALHATRKRHPARVVIAVPVGPPETCEQIGREADEMVCLLRPQPFSSVGQWYDDFRQTTDEEVIELLRSHRSIGQPGSAP
jgi:putative phosphoribosyl transferase